MSDMVGKGRKARVTHTIGENNPSAKLTELDVYCIRHWLKDGRWTQHEIAKAFNVSRTTISNINTGEHWANVKDAWGG